MVFENARTQEFFLALVNLIDAGKKGGHVIIRIKYALVVVDNFISVKIVVLAISTCKKKCIGNSPFTCDYIWLVKAKLTVSNLHFLSQRREGYLTC